MGFKEAVNSVLKQNYANFQGRAARSEYWFFALFVFIVAAILTALLFATVDFNTQQVSGLGYVIIAILAVFYLAILIPSIAVAVRRLHDRNMSGWWYLGFIVLSAIPFVGVVASIAMLVIFALKVTDGDSRFGPDPLRPSARPDIFA